MQLIMTLHTSVMQRGIVKAYVRASFLNSKL
jgi:hypothetical protein